jgi:hypothetical protein
MPRKDTHVYGLLVCLAENGEMTVEEVFAKVGKVNHRGLAGIARMLNDAVKYEYLVKVDNKFEIVDEIAAYLEDVEEITKSKVAKDLVPAFSKNIFTPEMKQYDTKLFQNKRGYS